MTGSLVLVICIALVACGGTKDEPTRTRFEAA
jgi:hypothetical protein